MSARSSTDHCDCDDGRTTDFWWSAVWATPLALAAGIMLLAVGIFVVIAPQGDYPDPHLQIVGPVVAAVMSILAAKLCSTGVAVKQGAGVGVFTAALILAPTTVLLGFELG